MSHCSVNRIFFQLFAIWKCNRHAEKAFFDHFYHQLQIIITCHLYVYEHDSLKKQFPSCIFWQEQAIVSGVGEGEQSHWRMLKQSNILPSAYSQLVFDATKNYILWLMPTRCQQRWSLMRVKSVYQNQDALKRAYT